MKISEIVEPTTEVIMEVKKSYYCLLKRQKDAEEYLDNPSISQEDKEKHILAFRIEIINPLNDYLQVLKEWGIALAGDEIMGGIKIE